MVHDHALSERWVVVYDLPCDFDLDRAMAGERLPYHWRPDQPARFGLIPRNDLGGDVRWIDVDPCYIFHTLNAYDDGDTLVIDAVRWPEMFDGDNNGPIESGRPALWRWTIDTAAGTAKDEQLSDVDEEFPRIDERLTGRRHRYGYGGDGPHRPRGHRPRRHREARPRPRHVGVPRPRRRLRAQRVRVRPP